MNLRSEVDWENDLISSRAELDSARSGIVMPTGRSMALQKLEMEMPSLMRDTFFSILVNSSEKLGNSVTLGRVQLYDLTGIIDNGRKTPPFFSRDLNTITMSHTLRLSELGALFVNHRAVWVPPLPLDRIPTRAYTGIIIDARGQLPVHGEFTRSAVYPCLFPKLWDTEMELLYERNSVKPEIAKASGIVRYSASLDETAYRNRIGADPLRITARGVFGQYRTDPILSRDDYLRIITSAENRALLAEGKVVILLDKETLANPTLGPVRDENHYYVRRSIEEQLKARSVRGTDFTDNWEGLKLTVYDIRFVADSARILSEEAGRIDIIADALKLAGPRARFRIEGHTASVGRPGGELTLSVERAQTIAAELSRRGIDSNRISASGFGGTRPLDTNETEGGRARNRRVEIHIELSGN